MANLFGFAGLVVSFVAFIFTTLALALPYWSWTRGSVSIISYEIYYGLWRYCVRVNIGGLVVCGDILEDIGEPLGLEDETRGTRAMVILGFMCIVGAMVACGVMLFFMKEQKFLGYAGCGLAALAGLFLMVAMAIFEKDLLYNEYLDHGFAFAFDIVGWLLSWLAAALMLAASIKGDISISSHGSP